MSNTEHKTENYMVYCDGGQLNHKKLVRDWCTLIILFLYYLAYSSLQKKVFEKKTVFNNQTGTGFFISNFFPEERGGYIT